MVQAFWKLYELKGVKVCKLVDIGINKELTPICLFTPESCKNLLLTLPEKYRGHPIIMSKKLTELLKSKGKKEDGFKFKLYQNEKEKWITVIAPEAQKLQLNASALPNNWEEYSLPEQAHDSEW